MPDAFQIVPLAEVAAERLLAFAAGVWPDDSSAHVLAQWWVRTDHAAVRAAIDPVSRAVAGLVVGVPSRWRLPGQGEVPAISICGWYVHPDFAGRGLGKALVNSFDEEVGGYNALSISDAAVRNFARLGWAGPFSTVLRLLVLPILHRRRLPEGFAVVSQPIVDARLPPALRAALDRIDAEKPADQLRRHRTAADWEAHFAVRPERRPTMVVLERRRQPVGYVLLRSGDSSAGRVYRLSGLHYCTDIVLNDRTPEALDAAFRAIAAASAKAPAVLLCTADRVLAQAASERGWLDEQALLLGPRLAAKAPRFMLAKALADLPAEQVQLTFADSDVDFNI